MDSQQQILGTGRDEITLLDVWQILVARKWVALSPPFIALLLGVFYLMQVTELYECSARVLVGQAGIERLVENPAVTVEKIVEKYRVEDKTVKRELPRLSSVFRDKKDTGNILQIKAVDATASGAKLYLEQVVAQVLASQHILFEQEMEKKQTRLEALSDQLERVEAFLQELEGRIGKMDRQDPAQATVLAVEKGGFLKLASELDGERYVLQKELDAVNSYPSQLIQVPSLPKKPINVKPSLVILFAGIFGLLLGGVATFFAEFILKFRQKAHLNNSQG